MIIINTENGPQNVISSQIHCYKFYIRFFERIPECMQETKRSDSLVSYTSYLQQSNYRSKFQNVLSGFFGGGLFVFNKKKCLIES